MEKLNFEIGDDIGKILSDISYDYLCKFNLEKARSIFYDSLIGEIPDDILDELTFGKSKLVKDNNEVKVIDNDDNKVIKNITDKIYSLFKSGKSNLSDIAKDICNYLANFSPKFISTDLPIDNCLMSSLTYYSDTHRVIQYILSTGKTPEYLNTDNLNDVDLRVFKNSVILYNKCIELFELIDKINEIINIMSVLEDITELKQFVSMETDKLYKFINQLHLLLDRELGIGKRHREERDKMIDDFLKFQGNIDEFFDKIKKSNEFKPVDITNKYDAGFLAPNGDFYGMYGITANLMHLKLADLIGEYVETIPPEEERYKDSYLLSKLGYCKITHNWVQFVGGSELTKDLVGHFIDLTEAQKDAICRMADSCYKGIFLTHDYKEEIHTSKFKQMDKFQIRKLFE